MGRRGTAERLRFPAEAIHAHVVYVYVLHVHVQVHVHVHVHVHVVYVYVLHVHAHVHVCVYLSPALAPPLCSASTFTERSSDMASLNISE